MSPAMYPRASLNELLGQADQRYGDPLVAELATRLFQATNSTSIGTSSTTARDHRQRLDVADSAYTASPFSLEFQLLRVQEELQSLRLRAETAECSLRHASTIFRRIENDPSFPTRS